MNWWSEVGGEDEFMVEGNVVMGEFCERGDDVGGEILEVRGEGGKGEWFFFDGGALVSGELCFEFRLGF